MIQRKCVICGKAFDCYPSDNKVTCSKECSRERQRRRVKQHPIKWGDEAKARAAQRGWTANLKLGAAAAQQSLIAGRFESNHAAKVWILVDSAGREYTVRNLLLWAREHTDLFDKPLGDKSAQQIASGFKAIAQTLRGNRGGEGQPRGAMTYFGWTLKALPTMPDQAGAEDELCNQNAKRGATKR